MITISKGQAFISGVVTSVSAVFLILGCGEGGVVGKEDTFRPRHGVAQDEKSSSNNLGEVTCNGSPLDEDSRLSIEDLEKEIRRSGTMCTNSGFRTSYWAISLANGIRSIQNSAERRRLVKLYFDQLAQINPCREQNPKKRERALSNFAQMLEPYEILLPELNDPERPFELMCICVGYYWQAIHEGKVDGRGGRETQREVGQRQWMRVGRTDPTWNYQAGLARFAMSVTNTYLPRAKENELLGNRHEYWQKRLRDALDGHEGLK